MVDGQYSYMEDLLKLEETATGHGQGTFRPASPLRQLAWQRALVDHPDKRFSHYLLWGISNGFHIGADRTIALRTNVTNMPLVQQPQLEEAHLGRGSCKAPARAPATASGHARPDQPSRSDPSAQKVEAGC